MPQIGFENKPYTFPDVGPVMPATQEQDELTVGLKKYLRHNRGVRARLREYFKEGQKDPRTFVDKFMPALRAVAAVADLTSGNKARKAAAPGKYAALVDRQGKRLAGKRQEQQQTMRDKFAVEDMLGKRRAAEFGATVDVSRAKETTRSNIARETISKNRTAAIKGPSVKDLLAQADDKRMQSLTALVNKGGIGSLEEGDRLWYTSQLGVEYENADQATQRLHGEVKTQVDEYIKLWLKTSEGEGATMEQIAEKQAVLYRQFIEQIMSTFTQDDEVSSGGNGSQVAPEQPFIPPEILQGANPYANFRNPEDEERKRMMRGEGLDLSSLFRGTIQPQSSSR